MKVLHWKGFTFTVMGGTAYFVRLHKRGGRIKPQVYAMKEPQLAAAVKRMWNETLAREEQQLAQAQDTDAVGEVAG